MHDCFHTCAHAISQIRSQQIHLYQIQTSGHLLRIHSIGPDRCSADDDLTLRMAEAAEERWLLEASSTARGSASAVSAARSSSQMTGRKRPADAWREDIDGESAGGSRQASGYGASTSTSAEEARQRRPLSRRASRSALQEGSGLRPPQQPPLLRPRQSAGVVLGRGTPGGVETEQHQPPPVRTLPMICGIRQRILAHLFKKRLESGGQSRRQQQVIPI